MTTSGRPAPETKTAILVPSGAFTRVSVASAVAAIGCLLCSRPSESPEARRRASADLPIQVQEVVFDGEQRRSRTARHADLCVDVLDMVLSCTGRDEQPRGDLSVATSLGKQAEHLHLDVGKPRGWVC